MAKPTGMHRSYRKKSAEECHATYIKYRDRYVTSGQKYRANIQKEVFAHYGNRCACYKCPETNPSFFTVDHLTKQGRIRDKGKSGSNLYRWLKKLGYPEDIQLMCFNCNCAR